ncbi:MAG: hypothetical protein ABT940_03675 [Alphaproteobacteria bacterium]
MTKAILGGSHEEIKIVSLGVQGNRVNPIPLVCSWPLMRRAGPSGPLACARTVARALNAPFVHDFILFHPALSIFTRLPCLGVIPMSQFIDFPV